MILLSNVKIERDISSNFCGLLRKLQLYRLNDHWKFVLQLAFKGLFFASSPLGLVACSAIWHWLHAINCTLMAFEWYFIPVSLLMSKNRSQCFVHFLFPLSLWSRGKELKSRSYVVAGSWSSLPFFLFRSASPFIPKNWLATAADAMYQGCHEG